MAHNLNISGSNFRIEKFCCAVCILFCTFCLVNVALVRAFIWCMGAYMWVVCVCVVVCICVYVVVCVRVYACTCVYVCMCLCVCMCVHVCMYLCVFDNHIIDADAPSYFSSNISWAALGNNTALQKRRKYQLIAEELRGSITPLICSTDCVLHTEYAAYQRRLVQWLAAKRGKPYSVVMSWVCVRTQFAIIRAVDLRLRGSCHKLYDLSLEEGCGHD